MLPSILAALAGCVSAGLAAVDSPGCSVGDDRPAITVDTLTVFLRGSSSIPAGVLIHARREVEQSLLPAGFAVSWRRLEDLRPGDTFHRLAVVDFNGVCSIEIDPRVGPNPRALSPALASTAVSDGKVLPFATIECDRLRRVLSPHLRTVDRKHREQVLGKAVGRVLAHELFHILTGSTRHGSDGLAKACYSWRDLVCDSLDFEERDLEAMREEPALRRLTAGSVD